MHKKLYYCVYCEKEFIEDKNYHLAEISDTYKTRNANDDIELIEYHGMCLDCIEQADKDYWSNFNYHEGLRI